MAPPCQGGRRKHLESKKRWARENIRVSQTWRLGANDEKAGHGPEEKGVRSGRSSRTNWQGGEGKANKIPVEVEVLCNCFFSKGPTTIEISAKLPIETDIFYEKGDQENHQGQIGEEGTRKQDHYGQSFMFFFLQDCQLQSLKKKSKIFIL